MQNHLNIYMTIRGFSCYVLFVLLIGLQGCLIDDDTDPDDIRDRFTGSWLFNESELKGTAAYFTVRISKDPGNSAQVIFQNFANLGYIQSCYGIVTANQITIPNQTVAAFVVSGNGIGVSNTKMNWSYTLSDAAEINNYSAEAIRQ